MSLPTSLRAGNDEGALHWQLVRIRHIAKLNPSKSEVGDFDRELPVSFLPMEAIGDDGCISLENEKPITAVENGYTYFRDDDVTIAKITPCFENGKGAIMRGLTNRIGFGTTELIVVRPDRSKVTSEFLHWLFVSTYFRRMGEAAMYGAGGQKRVPDDYVRDFRVSLPPLNEQKTISDFLDTETAKIDALVAEQRRLIELLKEKRQAVISHAVTKGLNPDAPMKPSGIEWLGDVPEHWVVGPVKHFFQMLNSRRIPVNSEDRASRQGRYPYYGASGIVDSIDKYIFDEDLVLVSEDGANLVNRSTPIAFVARGRYWVNNHAHILKPPDNCLVYWAERIESIDLYPLVTGSAQPKFTAEALLNLTIAIPPTEDERIGIEDHVITQTASIDRLSNFAAGAISLLQERRTALISAAVTGKIDVRNYQPDQAA